VASREGEVLDSAPSGGLARTIIFCYTELIYYYCFVKGIKKVENNLEYLRVSIVIYSEITRIRLRMRMRG